MESTRRVPASVLIVAGSETTSMYAEYCSWRGLQVRGVATAAGALRATAVALPDAAIISERLPDCTGHGLVRALRRSRHTFDLAIILLASQTFLADPRHTAKQGCDLVLTVPVLPDELVEALQRVMRSRAARPFESWLFRRGAESVWIVRTAPLELTVAGPSDRRAAYQFDAPAELRGFHADVRTRLMRTGYVLEATGADRRSGRERRRQERDGGDRRAIQ